MTAKHQVIHYGDQEYRGEVNDVIKWMLIGEGFSVFQPVATGNLNFTGLFINTPVVCPFEIFAFGDVRALTIHANNADFTNAPSGATVIATVNHPIPAGHRPHVDSVQAVGSVVFNSSDEYLVQYSVDSGGDVTVRQSSVDMKFDWFCISGSVQLQTTTIFYTIA
jgi:hypothetical protein